ncbi:DNA translocase FtsK [Rhizobium ruizarguesonis]
MSTLSLQQVMSSRFRTSAIADGQTKYLMEALGLSTKANVARLAIGRSLGLASLPDENLDAKGLEIPASSLFSQEDVALWIGFFVSHAQLFNGLKIDSMEALRNQLRAHWHRGAKLLIDDWRDSAENYDTFVTTLARRRADLPEIASAARSSEVPQVVQPTEDMSSTLTKALSEIGVSAEVRSVMHGPRLSRYRVTLKDVNQFDRLRRGADSLALVLGLQNQRPVIATSDMAKTVTIDIARPKDTWTVAGPREFLDAVAKQPQDGLYVCPGVDVTGNPVAFNLQAVPHLLVGGSTGQGKSVCVHALLTSLIEKYTPSYLKLALIDPKRVEFNKYAKSKFLWKDQIAAGEQASADLLDKLIEEMDGRYQRFETLGIDNIKDANGRGTQLPYIVACVDELAELVLVDRSAETKIARLAQKARAAGIHLILATQRPDAKTFSGLIRSNIPGRIALTVQKATESQIILDDVGAEDLLGAGDMIIKLPATDPIRAHGYFLSTADVNTIVSRTR